MSFLRVDKDFSPAVQVVISGLEKGRTTTKKGENVKINGEINVDCVLLAAVVG